jgi:hypothetical protein
MKRQKQNFLTTVGAVALALTPLAAGAAGQAETAATSQPSLVQPSSAAPKLNLATTPSTPVRDVMKIVNSGVSEDVVKAYIQTSSSRFSLTSDDIIQLQGAGVSSSITVAMLNHDTALRQNLSVPPPPPDQPPLPPPDQTPGATTAPSAPPSTAGYGDATAYYSSLAPYGNWSYLPDYGYYWQPYSTFWTAYPGWGYPWWGWLNTGWWFYAGHGWCWFPHFHDHGFGHSHDHGFGFPGQHDHGSGFHGVAQHGVAGQQHGVAGQSGFAGGQGNHQSTIPGGTRFGGGNPGIGNRSVTMNHSVGGPRSMGGQTHFQTFGGAPTVHQPMAMNRPMGGGFHSFSTPGGVGHSGGGFSRGSGGRSGGGMTGDGGSHR